MFSQNIVILLLVTSGGGRRSLFTMEVSALEDTSLVEVDDDDLIDNVLHNLTDEDIVDLTSTTSTTAAQPPHFRDDPLTVFRFIPPGRIIFIEDCCRRDYERNEYSSHFFPRSPSTERKHRVYDWHTVPGTFVGRLIGQLR